MDGKLRNRFLALLFQKEQREARRITYTEIAETAGVRIQTVSRWVNNEVTKIDAPVIEAFCRYFDCDVGDLLYIEPNIEEKRGD